MDTLDQGSCEACRVGAEPVSDDEIAKLMPLIPGWQLTEVAGVTRLSRTFKLADFAAALDLTNKVGAIAEAENHHPQIITEWGSVTVSWWTHKINALHMNDFIMAARSSTLV